MTTENMVSTSQQTLRVLAGPYQAFMPLRVSENRFSDPDASPPLAPLPKEWIPSDFGAPSHGDLAADTEDRRLHIAARVIREDVSSSMLPVLVLPELSQQVVAGTDPGAGRIPVAEMLRSLQIEAGDLAFDVRLIELQGIDTGERTAQLDRDLLRLHTRLSDAGVLHLSVSRLVITPSTNAYWRCALNYLAWMGDGAAQGAKSLLEQLTDEQFSVAARDHDGRQIIGLAPPPGRPIPAQTTTSPNDDDKVEHGTPTNLSPQESLAARNAKLLQTTATSRIDLNGRRITFVCEKLADRSGGAERVLIELANELARRGYTVEILSHELRGITPFYPLEFGVRHINLSPRADNATRLDRLLNRIKDRLKTMDLVFPINRLAFWVRYARFSARLGRHIDASEPHVVVPFMPPAIVASALARTRHMPRFVASMHNAPEQDFENPDRWDPGPYARRRRLEAMERLDSIAVLLPEYQDWYLPGLGERTTVVPNAVTRIDPARLAATTRNRTILSVGRLADVKRHDLSLRAFAAIADEIPDWTLKIYGVGPFAKRLESLRDSLGLRGRALLLGHTDAIAEEYLTAGVLCHPARFEGFPLAVTEALASGLPVIGFSDCSGLNSLVVDDYNGLVIDPGDGSDDERLKSLISQLRRVVLDDELRERLGQTGPSSMEPYAPDRVADLWETVLFP
jgi:glycosyltransferase involved in cell wall biosynthesis